MNQLLKNRDRPVRWAVALGLALALPAGGSAQQGGIAGTVTEQTGLPVPGVRVTATSPALGGETGTAITSSRGSYALNGLPPGSYELEFLRPGFRVETVRDVSVTAGARTTIDVQLTATTTTTLSEITVAVTGTHFEGLQTNLPYAVDVMSISGVREEGSPLVVDLFKRLGANQGALGEALSWYSPDGPIVPETVANVNLRGLGASRTLVLLNGRRQVYAAARLPGGRFVDVNAFPSIALSRIEVLKEGASAIYGSDAVAGVANFVTRGDFRGLEVTAAHDYFSGAGDSSAGAIFGTSLGETTSAVISAEWARRQELEFAERPWSLRPYPGPGGGGWSFYGNPGAFLMPSLTGDETPQEFTSALIAAQTGDDPSFFLDPACEDFGGTDAAITCRFRYSSFENMIEEQTQVRAFAEVESQLGESTTINLEGLWAQATVPAWRTTPSFPPISLYDGLQVVLPENPGRQAFCASSAADAGFASSAECLEDDWYFFGRMVGNSGPARALERSTGTSRVAASLRHDLASLLGSDGLLDISMSYSSSRADVRQPAEYAYRKFLAFRGFGGADCGVDVVVDPTSASGMSLGPTNGAVAGQGACSFYNPFSNSIRRGEQPGARFTGQDNPNFAPEATNSPDLLAWINEEVILNSTANLFVADATLTGTAIEEKLGYALGYQFRHLGVTGQPNDPGNQSLNPCQVPGDRTCLEQAGPFTFTTGFFPYETGQSVHRFYGELPVTLGGRLDMQFAANYEFHDAASSFDPKAAVRLTLAESEAFELALRGSAQSTFRVPSVDDVNTDVITTLRYVQEVDVYKAVDTYGSPDLMPERATTGNAGLVVRHFPSGLRATLDYWAYDFRDIINVVPHAAITRLYHNGGADRAAVQDLVKCPDGWGTGTCDAALIERIRVNLTNWPGMQTSGLDFGLGLRRPAGRGALSLSLEGTYTRQYDIKALEVNGVELQSATEGVGSLNRFNPLAYPLPQLKWSASAGYSADRFSAIGHYHHISSYDDPDSFDPDYRVIGSFGTFDATLMVRLGGGLDAFVTGFNLLGKRPPIVNIDGSYDALTHDPKGRRLKAGITWTSN